MSTFAIPSTRPRIFLLTFGAFLLVLAWDYSGLDLAMARWFGSASGFALTNHWLWRGVLHDDIQLLPWLFELVLVLAVFWPWGAFRQLALARRLQLALTTLLALLVISIIKLYSRTSCPWDLQQFGGTAIYLSHWAWRTADGGTGRCFPAGHAAAGFAFFGGFFTFRHVLPRTARRWFAGAMVTGLVLGLAQQLRGAHYMSHTLWTAWLCWTVAAVVDAAVSRLTARIGSRAEALAPLTSKLAPSTPAK